MNTFETTFSELRERYMELAKDDFSRFTGGNLAEVRYTRSKWDEGGFYGCRTDEMVEYLREGYNVRELENLAASAIPVKKRRKSRFNDSEGDFRFDLFESGDENCFIEWTKREAIPGIEIEFFTGFLGSVSSSTIGAYSRWILQALIAIEGAGIDYSLFNSNKGTRRFVRDGDLYYRLEIKKEGERSDYLAWSALFSPGGYRHLGFLMFCYSAECLGKTVKSGFGQPNSAGWGVKYDKENRRLVITHNGQHDSTFPAEEMTRQLQVALADAKTTN